MDMPKDPYTLPSGLTFVQNELWEADRLKLAIRRVPTKGSPEERQGRVVREIGAMTEVNIPKEDDESNGKHIALLMLAQHPSLHKPNTPERVVTEHVNGLLRHMYGRLSMEANIPPPEPHTMPTRESTLSDRVTRLEAKVEELENLTAVPNKVEGSS